MSDLLVRGLDDAVAQALRERAAANGRSAEAEHRHILTTALTKARKRSFAQVLAAMPNVGTDADFARVESAASDDTRATRAGTGRVFD